MKNRFFKAISAALASLVLLAATVPAVSAETAAKEEYQSTNAAQKAYYTNTYVPSYQSYRQALTDLRNQIRQTEFQTAEQAQRVLNFLNDLKSRHRNFFGTRETAGKSRYDVPAAREAMYKAADHDKNYTLAIGYCNTLKSLVEARVGFLNSMKNDIQSFKIIASPTTGVTTTTGTVTTGTSATTVTTVTSGTTATTTTVSSGEAAIVFNADQIWSTYSFGFKIIITNKTNREITDWSMSYSISGATVNSMWTADSALSVQIHGGNVSVRPQNKHQAVYTLPANGTIVLEGSANGNANNVSVSGGMFNSVPVTISFVK